MLEKFETSLFFNFMKYKKRFMLCQGVHLLEEIFKCGGPFIQQLEMDTNLPTQVIVINIEVI